MNLTTRTDSKISILTEHRYYVNTLCVSLGVNINLYSRMNTIVQPTIHTSCICLHNKTKLLMGCKKKKKKKVRRRNITFHTCSVGKSRKLGKLLESLGYMWNHMGRRYPVCTVQGLLVVGMANTIGGAIF